MYHVFFVVIPLVRVIALIDARCDRLNHGRQGYFINHIGKGTKFDLKEALSCNI